MIALGFPLALHAGLGALMLSLPGLPQVFEPLLREAWAVIGLLAAPGGGHG
jgi:flagellar biosynthesis protein FliR